MNKRLSGRTGLFLLELIIAILFFIIAAAVCIQLFVKSHLMGKDTRELAGAVKLCTNQAELYTAHPEEMTAYYNAEFEKVNPEEGVYMLTVKEVSVKSSTEGTMRTASVSFREKEKGNLIYTLNLEVYKEAGSNE